MEENNSNGRRWKFASALLCGYAALVSYWHFTAKEVSEPVVAKQASTAKTIRSFRQIRGAVKGRRELEFDLLGKLSRGGSIQLKKRIITNLGFVGGEPTVEALRPIIFSDRGYLSRAAIETLGKIATDNAVALLLEIVDNPRYGLEGHAVSALGSTRSQAAKDRLLEIAMVPGQLRSLAISALGELGDPSVIPTLKKALEENANSVAASVAEAARNIGTPESFNLLFSMMESQSRAIRYAAISEAPIEDPRFNDLISAAAYSSDSTIADAAISRLGEREDKGFDILSDLVFTGNMQTRRNATYALSEVDTKEATEILTQLFLEGGPLTQYAASALSQSHAVEDFAATVLSAPKTSRFVALQNLAGQSNGEVDMLFAEIAEIGTAREKEIALNHFVYNEDPKATDMAIAMLEKGGASRTKSEAIWALGRDGSAEAREALLAEASKPGNSSWRAMDALVENSSDDPRVLDVISTKFNSGRENDAMYAANALAQSGSPQAREMLLDAISGDDSKAAAAAANVILDLDDTEEVREALIELANSTKSTDLKARITSELLSNGGQEGVDLVAQAVESGNDKDAYFALSAAGNYLDQNSELKKLVTDTIQDASSDSVRATALDALSYSSDPGEYFDTYAEMLQDPSDEVRRSAAFGLGQVDTKDSVSLLAAQINNPESDNRSRTLQILSQSERPEAQSAISQAIQSADLDLAIAAISTVSGSEAGVAHDAAMDALFSDNSKLATAAAQHFAYYASSLDDAARDRIGELDATLIPMLER